MFIELDWKTIIILNDICLLIFDGKRNQMCTGEEGS